MLMVKNAISSHLKGLQVGQTVESGAEADIKVGNALPLQNIPVGTVIHNIELKPGKVDNLLVQRVQAHKYLVKKVNMY